MNIWIINHYAVTPESPGGTRHFDLAVELAKRGHDVTIIASSFHYATLKETRSYPKGSDTLTESTDNVRFVWIRTKPYRGNGAGRVRNMLEFAWKLRRLRKTILPKPDVIVGSSVHLFAVFGAYRLARCFDVPFVMEVRDIWPRTLIDMGVSRWHPFIIFLSFLEPFLYRRAQKIITLLPKAAEHIGGFGIDPKKIVWISNGVVTNRFKTVAAPDFNRRPFTVLYAGTLGKANNLEPLIEAARKLGNRPAIRFVLAGEGPLRSRLEAMASGLKNVRFQDAVRKERVPALLAEADALFVGLKDLPLYRFGMSMNKVFDYMAAGRPIIFAANVPENPVKKARCGLVVPPDDPEAIVKAIRTLYNYTPQERFEMAKRGRTYVEKHFDIQVIASAFESTLKKATETYEKNS